MFDSWPLLALLQREATASRVRSLIHEAHARRGGLWITVVNLGEIWYQLARRHPVAEADAAVESIQGLGFEIADIDWSITREASRFKSQYPLSYADCFAAALAKRRNGELVTGDPEFKRLEKEIRIHWV